MLVVLGIGGFVVLGLFAAGLMVWLRHPAPSTAAPLAVAALSAATQSTPPRLEPSLLLAETRRQASAWKRDAVLVSLSAGPLDAGGVVRGGKLEASYAEPSGQRISGGAETGAERLVFRSSTGELAKTEARAAKSRIVPEPNCAFEAAWAAAQRAGESADAGSSLHYSWSEKHARPVWEVLSAAGQVQRRLDGVTCSILTR
jgi:hypothetical protein